MSVNPPCGPGTFARPRSLQQFTDGGRMILGEQASKRRAGHSFQWPHVDVRKIGWADGGELECG